jgi:protein gp37
MNKTKIEWVKNPDGTQGYTWNPITGCLNGCSYCYARKLANTRLKERYLANTNLTPDYLAMQHALNRDAVEPFQNPFYPRFWPERLEQPFEIRGSMGIFPCDMSDLFGISIPHHWTEAVLNVIKIAEQHRFYLLTKQPQNLKKFSPFPDNCWVGVSATDHDAYCKSLHKIKEIEAKVKFISFEPLLESQTEQSYYSSSVMVIDLKYYSISWVIIGAQTKPYKPPKIEWVQEIVEACDNAGIPVFLKDNLRPLAPKQNFGDWFFPLPLGNEYGTLRQEFPSA